MVSLRDRADAGKRSGPDLEVIQKAGLNTQTPIIITNSSDLLDVIPSDRKTIKAGEELITVLF